MYSYNPKDVTVIYNGNPITGFGPGTMIKVSRNEDTWSFQPSNSGGGARSRNPNRSGRIEITLQTGSPSNGVLSAFAVVDELTGQGVGECFIKDRSTLSAAGLTGAIMARNAWIVKHADFERAKEVGEVTWTIESEDIEIIHAGLIDA